MNGFKRILPREAIEAQEPEMFISTVHPKAYLAGCINGDAYLSKPGRKCKYGTFGLNAKDLDFVQMFVACIRQEYGFEVNITKHSESFFSARRYNSKDVFSGLESYEPQTQIEIASWIRGVFDSDGSVFIGKHKGGRNNSRHRLIVICQSYLDILQRVKTYLLAIGIASKIYNTKLSKSHYGTKPMYRLQITGGRSSFGLFASLVGSSIKRKSDKIKAIVETYCDLKVTQRSAQLLGAKTKNEKRVNQTIPYVLDELRLRVASGRKPRMRECMDIKGYGGLLRYHNHSELLAMAFGESN